MTHALRGNCLASALIALVYAAPWLWLGCFGIFTAAVTFEVGHFPSYSNPDPKHVESLSALYELTVLLFILMGLSPILVGLHAGARGLRARTPRVPGQVPVYLLGMALAALVIFGDPFGLASWLFD